MPPHIRTLLSPPIEEAILDIKFVNDSAVDPSTVEKVAATFSGLLPFSEMRDRSKVAETHSLDHRLRLMPPEIAGFEAYRANHQEIGEITRSVSVRADSVTIRHTKPYGGWEELYDYAAKAFAAYVAATNPSAVIRLAARYVNKIVMPNRYFDFDEFFRYGPQVPGEVSQQVFDFQTRIGVQGDPLDLRAWISQYLHHELDMSLAVMLDIDVFRSDWHDPKWKAIETPLEEIHIMKNKLFFGSLTDSALRGYE